MMPSRNWKWMLWGTLVHAVCVLSAAGAEKADDAFTRDFGVIVDRNMFLRDRRPTAVKPVTPPPAPATTDAAPPPPPPPPEKQYVLVGVVFEDLTTARAYFEHVGEGTLVKIAPGEPLANGHVTEVQLNSVAYMDAKGLTWVDVGDDLTGAPMAVSGPTHEAGEAGAGTTSADAKPGEKPAADPAALSIEERLRRRRQQELGQ